MAAELKMALCCGVLVLRVELPIFCATVPSPENDKIEVCFLTYGCRLLLSSSRSVSKVPQRPSGSIFFLPTNLRQLLAKRYSCILWGMTGEIQCAPLSQGSCVLMRKDVLKLCLIPKTPSGKKKKRGKENDCFKISQPLDYVNPHPSTQSYVICGV